MHHIQSYHRGSAYGPTGGGGGGNTSSSRTAGMQLSPADLSHDVTYQALIRQRAAQIMNEKEAIYSRLARRGQEKKVGETRADEHWTCVE